jgi:hypothetical protein
MEKIEYKKHLYPPPNLPRIRSKAAAGGGAVYEQTHVARTSWYYDTEGFRAYRRSFIEKINRMAARVTVHGSGGPEIKQAVQGARHLLNRQPVDKAITGLNKDNKGAWHLTTEDVERFLEYYTAECAKAVPDEDVLKTMLPYLAWKKTHVVS